MFGPSSLNRPVCPDNELYGYLSLTPPAFCNPKELYSKILGESYNDPDNTERFLEAYQPKTPAKQKAKEYWSSYWGNCTIYEEKKEVIDKIRQDYPNEVDRLLQKLWKRHVVKKAEQSLCLHYDEIKHKGLIKVPEDFVDLESYKKVEKADIWEDSDYKPYYAQPVKGAIRAFPDATQEIKWAKNYFLGLVLPKERENIPEKYLPQVKRFRVLLWKRHLKWTAGKISTRKKCEKSIREANEKSWKETRNRLALILAVITVASFFLASFGRQKLNFSFYKPLYMNSLGYKSIGLTKGFIKNGRNFPVLLHPTGQTFCPCGGGTVHCAWDIAKFSVQPAKL